MEIKNYLTVKSFENSNYREYYFTLDLNTINSEADVLKIYQDLYRYLYSTQIDCIYERILGATSFKKGLLQTRKEFALAENKTLAPISYLEGITISGAPLSSVVIYGIKQKKPNVRIQYIRDNFGEIIGCNIDDGQNEFLYLFGLYSVDSSKSPEEKYQEVFDLIEDLLTAYSYEPGDIVRTWFYIKDIFTYYTVFNKVRKDFLKKHQIRFDAESNNLPSSTCVEGYFAKDSFVGVNLYCIKKDTSRVNIERVFNTMQNEADGVNYKYSPTFSRGLIVEGEYIKQFQISGTASIDKHGKTVYPGDPYKQIKHTMENIKNMLTLYNFEFQDIVQSTCFYYDKSYYNVYLKVLEDMGLRDISASHIISNICREDLLFEFDGIAIKMLKL